MNITLAVLHNTDDEFMEECVIYTLVDRHDKLANGVWKRGERP